MKACKECPFHKKSAAGWIGEHNHIDEIIDYAIHDVPFPCHMEVNSLVEKGYVFKKAYKTANNCTGQLQFMNNMCKLSRDKKIALLQKEAGRSELIFKTPTEMRSHHLEV